MITIFIVGLLIGAEGCQNNVGNTDIPASAVVTENPVETMISATTGSALIEHTVGEELYNTITDGVYTSEKGEIQIQVPKGWKTIENNKSVLIVPDIEDVITDNLHVQIADKDENFASYAEPAFQKSFEEKFDEISFEKFEKITVIGLPAIKMVYKITQNNVEITEYQYMIDGNQTIIITYTNVNNLLTEEEFDACVNSIQILSDSSDIRK